MSGQLQEGAQVPQGSPWLPSGGPVTQGFMPGPGAYEPNHTGVDVGVPTGTPITAGGSGVVHDLNDPSGFGTYVVEDLGGGVQVLAGHLSSYGQPDNTPVHAGDVIGYSGDSGWSTGPHTHFQESVNGQVVDPSAMLLGYGQGGTPQGLVDATLGGAVLGQTGQKIVKGATGGVLLSPGGGAAASSIFAGAGNEIAKGFEQPAVDAKSWVATKAWPAVIANIVPLVVALGILLVIMRPSSGSGSSSSQLVPIPV